jgi:hypothetical protein
VPIFGPERTAVPSVQEVLTQMPSERDERLSTVEAERPDLFTQLEAMLHEVWQQESAWRREDRIDLAARLYRES